MVYGYLKNEVGKPVVYCQYILLSSNLHIWSKPLQCSKCLLWLPEGHYMLHHNYYLFSTITMEGHKSSQVLLYATVATVAHSFAVVKKRRRLHRLYVNSK